MLNRRYLRIKVMQVLYSFLQSSDRDMNKGEKELFRNVEKIYDLYLSILFLFIEIQHQAENILQEGKNKKLPTTEELTPSRKFLGNRLIKQLSENKHLKKEIINRKISWQLEPELVKKIFNTIRGSEEYAAYMNSIEDSYLSDKNFVIEIFKKYISEFEPLLHHFEEKSIYWVDDVWLVNSNIIKTLEFFNENTLGSVMQLYKDEADDKHFITELFRKTILMDIENEKLISSKTKNWELERIAMMDVLLMKMAITEMLVFSNIPVKVTLNEYIEISKLYSTPKSKMFINGILDSLVIDFKEQQKFVKTGRGLME